MPTVYQGGNPVHFMGRQNYIGFYPGAEGIAQFPGELEALGLKYTKGTVQFPLKKGISWELTGKMIRFRAAANQKA